MQDVSAEGLGSRKRGRKRRTKNRQERPIKEIVFLVWIWRTLCDLPELKDILKPYPPRKAAIMLGARPGTMYDYEKRVKKCRDLGFNFRENKDKCIGALTRFIAEKKENNGRTLYPTS